MGNYVEKNLRAGDSVVAKAEFSWIPMIPAAILAVLVLIVAGNIWNFGIGFILALVIVIWKALVISSQELGVSNKNIIGKTGVILNRSLDARLEKIDNFAISETLAGKIFGYSTIQVNTTSAMLHFTGVKNAMELKHSVLDTIDALENEKQANQARMIANTTPAE